MSWTAQSLRRRALEVEGWIELHCPERALELLEGVVEHPTGREVGLALRVRVMLELRRTQDALDDLLRLRAMATPQAPLLGIDSEWLDLTEGWCRKRLDDLPGAIACMERLVGRSNASAIGHFNLGCYLALVGNTERAWREVALACSMSRQFRELAASETDLASLQGDPRFDALVGRSQEV